MNKFFYVFLFLFVFSCYQKAETGSSNNVPLTADSVLTSINGLRLDSVQLPDGFKIDVFARVPDARSLVLTDNGTLFVGNRGGHIVYAVRDVDGDWKADERYEIVHGLEMPNGIAFKDGALFIAEVSKLWRFDNIEERLSNPPAPIKIYDDYPKDRHHGWKYIAFGPDGKLYVPVGAPCNICESRNEIYASITRMNADGSGREIYAQGVRNTVGFTWHPKTGEMWFTDNGRDWMGNDVPPCELNRITEAGQHFGYPYCHGGVIKDPEYGDKHPCEDFVKPSQNLGPHVAPLGLKFCSSASFPASYHGKIFIAEHGSWNRDTDVGHTGHKITMVTEENGVGVAYEDFATGFLDEAANTAWARPVDLVFAPDGSMLVSDDLGGTIFRIRYEK